jgi:hypothetical protein
VRGGRERVAGGTLRLACEGDEMMAARQERPRLNELALDLLDLVRAVVLSRTQLISLALFSLFLLVAVLTRQLVVQAIMASVAASFMFSFVFFSFDVSLKHLDRRHFRHFFGSVAINNKLHLVYPAFVLSDEARHALKDHNAQLIYRKLDPKFSQTYRIDVPRVVADNDLRALVYLVGLFGDTCGKAPPIRVDAEAVVHSHESFISFGLSSNECTHMYLQHCPEPGFAIVPDDKGSEYLTYVDSAGRPREFHSTANAYYGVIVRYHPDPEDAPERHWFLCAGLGPNGTSGAAWFLANKWRRLYRLVGEDDFVAIIRVEHYSDSDSTLLDVKKLGMRGAPDEKALAPVEQRRAQGQTG